MCYSLTRCTRMAARPHLCVSVPPWLLQTQTRPGGNVPFAIRSSTTLKHHPPSFSRCHADLARQTQHDDGRARLSGIWIPTGRMAVSPSEDSHSRLLRAGFLRQAHSGLYHMLPMGRRVQDKLEALIDKYMSKLGASKLALSSISSEEIWTRSGRLEGAGSEAFRFKDRKGVRYILSPTHEEEITYLVSSIVKSYRDLPLRLYQISRKYRDEIRPRQGLLRSREFVMKDLYTFDYNTTSALETYHQVREVYGKIFDELRIPYLVADADSGNMGGKLSHEFHFPTPKGEDNVISCTRCNYVANEELAENLKELGNGLLDITSPGNGSAEAPDEAAPQLHVFRGVSQDRHTLIQVWYLSGSDPSSIPSRPEVNLHAVKAAVPGFDPSVDDPLPLWINSYSSPSKQSRLVRIVNLVDCRVQHLSRLEIESHGRDLLFPQDKSAGRSRLVDMETLYHDPSTAQGLNLLRIKDGDRCARCATGVLRVQKAIELGHTFHLGARYSHPLDATVTVPVHFLGDADADYGTLIEKSNSSPDRKVPMQMGCHGIGVSRMIAAVADTLADEKGLNWPRVIAPFEAVVVPGKGLLDSASEVYDLLSSASHPDRPRLDVVLDDRATSFPWKMQDADLIGYPVIVVVGRRWDAEKVCEVQCRRLHVHQELPVDELLGFVQSLLSQL